MTNSSKAGADAEKQHVTHRDEQDRLKNQPAAQRDRDEMLREKGEEPAVERIREHNAMLKEHGVPPERIVEKPHRQSEEQTDASK